jgi:hypothetical protein
VNHSAPKATTSKMSRTTVVLKFMSFHVAWAPGPCVRGVSRS